MKYSVAFIAAFAGAASAAAHSEYNPAPVSQIGDGQIQAPTGYEIAPAPPAATTPVASESSAVETPEESTVYATSEVTITSCAPTVTDCPASSTVVSKTTYPAEQPPAVTSPTSSAPVETIPSVIPPVETASSSAPVETIPSVYPTAPVPESSKPATTPVASESVSIPPPAETTPVASESSVPAPPAETPSYSVITIETCVPTTIYSTVPVPGPSGAPGSEAPAPPATVPVASSSQYVPAPPAGTGAVPPPVGGSPSYPAGGVPAPYPTASGSGVPGVPSGTGAVPYPTSSPIATGAGSALGAPLMAGTVAAIVAVLFA